MGSHLRLFWWSSSENHEAWAEVLMGIPDSSSHAVPQALAVLEHVQKMAQNISCPLEETFTKNGCFLPHSLPPFLPIVLLLPSLCLSLSSFIH